MQGLAFAVHVDGRKYLISRAGQKNLTNVIWQTRVIHSSLDISQCQESCPACRGGVPAPVPVGPELWSVGDSCQAVTEPGTLRDLSRYPKLQGWAAF